MDGEEGRAPRITIKGNILVLSTNLCTDVRIVKVEAKNMCDQNGLPPTVCGGLSTLQRA